MTIAILLMLFLVLVILLSVLRNLDIITGKLSELTKQETTEMKNLTDLQAEVAANTTVEKSAVVLIQGLAAQISAAKNDPAAIDAIVNQLNANDADLAAAITANTPATDTPAAAATV